MKYLERHARGVFVQGLRIFHTVAVVQVMALAGLLNNQECG